MSDKPTRENIRQHGAFLVYSQIPESSVQKLWETWEKHGQLRKYTKPSPRTLEEWCSKYQWVARAEAIYKAAKEEAVKKEIDGLAMAKKEILAITRAVMIRYGQQLRENMESKITASDFEKAWKIQRIELGLPTEIGNQEVAVKDSYGGVSDDELLEELESLAKRYKERLDERST